jgi:hypothetical protein
VVGSRRTRRSAPWAGLVLGLVVAWFGLSQSAAPAASIDAGSVPGPGVAAAPVTSSAPAAVSSPSPVSSPVPVTSADPVPPPRQTPVLLHVPALELEAPITPVEVDPDGRLQVPDDPAVLGWWREGAAPGADTGSVVLDGHVDSRATGPGAFFHLADLRPGDPVVLDHTGGQQAYVVVAVRSYAKPDLPAETFDQQGEPRLVLITCGGSFDTAARRYNDNVVVYAVPQQP